MVFICITAFVVMGLFIGAITMAMTESMDQMKEEKAAADEERMKEFFAQNEVGKKAAEAKEADGGAPPRDVRKLGMTYEQLRSTRRKRRIRELLDLHWGGSQASGQMIRGRTDDDALEMLYPTARARTRTTRRGCACTSPSSCARTETGANLHMELENYVDRSLLP